MRKLITISLFLTAICCYCSLSLPVKGQSLSKNIDLALVGGTIYPSPTQKSITNGVILISNGRITAVGEKVKIKIPPRSRILDCTGLTLTSGFWNSHVHFLELKWENAATMSASKLSQQLRDMLTKYGFTYVFDTGSVWANTLAIRRRIELGELDGPKIFSVGEILSVKGGVPPPALMKRFGFMPDAGVEIGTPQEGTEKAKQQLDKGVDAIKIYAATTGRTLVEMPAGSC